MGVVFGPRPTAEARALVVGERLLDLFASVHHERTVLSDGFCDRLALKKQTLDGSGSRRQLNGGFTREHDAGGLVEGFVGNLQRFAVEEVQHAADVVAGWR